MTARNLRGLWGARPTLVAVIVVAAAALAAALGAALPPMRAADQGWHDQLTRWMPDAPAPPDVIIVDIDERSLQELGPWPWPRSLLAELAQRLRAQGARMQVWDLYLPEEAPGDHLLAEQLRRGDIVLGQAPVVDPSVQDPPLVGRLVTAAEDAAPPLCSQTPPVTGHLGLAPQLAQAVDLAAVGHLVATPDPDGRLRRLPAVICTGSAAVGAVGASPRAVPQIALAAAARAEPQQTWQLRRSRLPWQPAQWLQRGSWRFALDAQGWLSIPYRRAHDHWPAVSAARLLRGAATGEPGPELSGRIVLLGSTALGSGDRINTPRHTHAPGVSIHAELLAQALAAGDHWPAAPVQQPRLMAALLALCATLALWPWQRIVRSVAAEIRVQRPVLAAPLLASTVLALSLPASVAAVTRLLAGPALPVMAPTAAAAAVVGVALLWAYQRQRQAVRALAEALADFVPPVLAQHIAQQAVHPEGLGQVCNGILLGVRIEGLDAWVSTADSLQALALIHAIHASAHRVAQRHNGRLANAQGATLYVEWPDAPAPTLRSALQAAQQLRAELISLLRRNESAHRPLSVYMALEQGAYLHGLVGHPGARRSVVLGPVANDVLAMLQLAIELAAPIVVGAVAAQVPLSPHSDPRLQPMGHFLLPNRNQPHQLWQYIIADDAP
ncbi:CHASE2 domain-containing protein [Tepidimonas charontis]|uniref:CHASE2 domain protein n=1 Tax=Tepidimonas charontis TaxID=2267262 RepID=A0A554XCB6_9BURK|nr:CHASE2 domain-containing protein [Tepidimonas charontis]TSE33473.1 CHASE2 domain protein [Tepidimonas charontis]